MRAGQQHRENESNAENTGDASNAKNFDSTGAHTIHLSGGNHGLHFNHGLQAFVSGNLRIDCFNTRPPEDTRRGMPSGSETADEDEDRSGVNPSDSS